MSGWNILKIEISTIFIKILSKKAKLSIKPVQELGSEVKIAIKANQGVKNSSLMDCFQQ
jgi:hypothetical protein